MSRRLWKVVQEGCVRKTCQSMQGSLSTKEKGVQLKNHQISSARVIEATTLRSNKRETKLKTATTNAGII